MVKQGLLIAKAPIGVEILTATDCPFAVKQMEYTVPAVGESLRMLEYGNMLGIVEG